MKLILVELLVLIYINNFWNVVYSFLTIPYPHPSPYKVSYNYETDLKIAESRIESITGRNQIAVCRASEEKWWKDQGTFLKANSKIQQQKYFLGYRFDDQLSRYNGRVGIYFSVLGDNVDKLVLHSRYTNITSFSISETTLKNNTSNKYKIIKDDLVEKPKIFIITTCVFENKSDVLLVSFNRNLSSDEEYKLDIEFNGIPSEGMNGIYRSSYQVPLSNNNNSGVNSTSTQSETIISTHFEPTHARQAFPCFDEPSMKAKFSIYLTYSTSLKSYSNMPIKSKMENGDNTTTVFFEESPPMSTYLVAFTINNYSVISKISDSINEVNVSVLLPSHMIEKGEFALEVATKALKLFESLTLIPYALNKLDLIGIPSFEAGAMENWGLITFRLTQMVFDNETVSTKGKEYVAQTVIHEISHQWFGNYVTMKGWNDIWLNEGFATFMEIYATDRLFPQWDIVVEERALYRDGAIGFDQLNVTHPMAVPENFTGDIKTLFDSISYSKSGSVLAMLHEVIGDETFWVVIKKYLNKYAFNSASSTDLWNVLNEEIKTPYVNQMIQSWISNTGFPLVSVTMVNKSNDQSLISISQNRFILSSNMENINLKSPEKWTIPISYRVKYDTNNTMYNGVLWLTEPTQQFKLNGSIKLLKINKERVGFYVTQYDIHSWEQIIHQLEIDKNELSPSDKISLLSDSMRLSKNGMINFNIPMKLLRILVNDINFYVQINCLSDLDSIGWLIENNDQIHKLFEKFTRAYLNQRYYELKSPTSNLNFTSRHKTLFLNTVTSMCVDYNCSGVISDLLNLYKEWDNTKIKIDPGMFSAVVKAVAIHGTPEDITSLENYYNSTEDPHLKRRFLSALARVKNENLLEKYLNASVFGNLVQIQELGSFFSAISNNKYGTNITWNFIRTNWNELKAKLVDSDVTLSGIVPAVSTHFKTTAILKELDEFYNANQNSIFYKDYKLAMEIIQTNIEWSARVLKSISQDDPFRLYD